MATYESESVCCLCCSVFSTISSKSKRKLLYGASALVELSVLKSVLKSWDPVMALTTIPQLYNRNAYLCMAYQRSLLKCKKLEGELDAIITNISLKINGNIQVTINLIFLMYYFSFHNWEKTIRIEHWAVLQKEADQNRNHRLNTLPLNTMVIKQVKHPHVLW